MSSDLCEPSSCYSVERSLLLYFLGLSLLAFSLQRRHEILVGQLGSFLETLNLRLSYTLSFWIMKPLVWGAVYGPVCSEKNEAGLERIENMVMEGELTLDGEHIM